VSGSVTPGTTNVCFRAFVESNSRMYTAAILPFPMAVTPSPTCRAMRLFCVIAFHAVDVPVPVAVDVGVTLREADTVTVRELEGVVVTVTVRPREPDTDAVVDPDRLPAGVCDAGSETPGVLDPTGDEVRRAVDDADAVAAAERVSPVDRVWVPEINPDFEIRLVSEGLGVASPEAEDSRVDEGLCETRAVAVPVVEPEAVPEEMRERVTDAVVDPDLEPLTVTVPLGDEENVFEDVDSGDRDAATEEDAATDAELTTVCEPEKDAESDEPGDALMSTTEAVGATDFDVDVLVVDDGDAERAPDAEGVVDATGAAEHDGRVGTDNKGSVEQATIRTALLSASLTKMTSSVARTRTPVGALNVAAVLTPSRKGVDTPTRPASVSTDLSE
jgi:hypothetical protein